MNIQSVCWCVTVPSPVGGLLYSDIDGGLCPSVFCLACAALSFIFTYLPETLHACTRPSFFFTFYRWLSCTHTLTCLTLSDDIFVCLLCFHCFGGACSFSPNVSGQAVTYTMFLCIFRAIIAFHFSHLWWLPFCKTNSTFGEATIQFYTHILLKPICTGFYYCVSACNV